MDDDWVPITLASTLPGRQYMALLELEEEQNRTKEGKTEVRDYRCGGAGEIIHSSAGVNMWGRRETWAAGERPKDFDTRCKSHFPVFRVW